MGVRPSAALAEHGEEIRTIVAEHRASNPRVFGSVLYGEDTEDSDLDILVDPAAGMSLFDVGAIRWKLRDLLGVLVDIVSPRSLLESFRDEVLAEAASV